MAQRKITCGTVLGTPPICTAKRWVFEADPWTAVEPVPYLFAVSLSVAQWFVVPEFYRQTLSERRASKNGETQFLV